jgi:hypothetical protein
MSVVYVFFAIQIFGWGFVAGALLTERIDADFAIEDPPRKTWAARLLKARQRKQVRELKARQEAERAGEE